MWPIIPTIKKYHVSTLSTIASFTFDLWVWQLGKAIKFWIPVRQYKYELVLSKHTSAPRSLKSAPRTKTLPPVAVAFPLMASRSHCFSPCSFQKERYPHTKSTLLVFCQFSFKLLPNFFICQNMFCHICYRHTHTHTHTEPCNWQPDIFILDISVTHQAGLHFTACTITCVNVPYTYTRLICWEKKYQTHGKLQKRVLWSYFLCLWEEKTKPHLFLLVF